MKCSRHIKISTLSREHHKNKNLVVRDPSLSSCIIAGDNVTIFRLIGFPLNLTPMYHLKKGMRTFEIMGSVSRQVISLEPLYLPSTSFSYNVSKVNFHQR